MRESLILCEGYDDRDFLAGWLQHGNGWSDPTKGGKEMPSTFAGGRPERGVFFFDSPSRQARVGLLPVGGRLQLAPRIRVHIQAAGVGGTSLDSLVVVADPDGPATQSPVRINDLVRQAIASAGQTVTGSPTWKVGPLSIEVVGMAAGTHGAAQLDPQERLERVVTAAFADAYPMRYTAMLQWLNQRPSPSGATGMVAYWSTMASWFPDGGCADYLRRAIWQDQPMAGELQRLLGAIGLDQVTARLG